MNKLIKWFAENHVASTLLMISIVLAGLISLPSINRVLFPTFVPGMISIDVPYRGAGPEEVEERILIRIEEAVQDIQGIERIVSRGFDGAGSVEIQTLAGSDFQKILNEVKNRVDSINTFPPEAENPIISEIIFRNTVIALAIYGDVDERTLVDLGEQIRDELMGQLSGVVFDVGGIRNDEVAIEVSEFDLLKYGLTFDEVAQAIRKRSINLPAGAVKSSGGDIEVKTRGQGYTAADFEEMVIRRSDDGTRVTVKDVATVTDGFEETQFLTRFEGVPAILLIANSDFGSDDIDLARSIKDYAEKNQLNMPEGVTLTPWLNISKSFEARMDMLLTNSLFGLALVFVVLFLFLRPLVAFWVTIGIFVSFIAPFSLLGYFGVSINMISTFAFLLILGIVVDDAIIVGESIHYAREGGKRGLGASIFGAQRVVKPVMFAAATTVIAFSIMFFFPGNDSQVIRAIPIVVILVLGFSLIECMFILPHHLSTMKPEQEPKGDVGKAIIHFQRRFANALTDFAQDKYRPLVERALRHRYTSSAAIFMAFFISIALLFGGWVRTEFAPQFNLDFVSVRLQMNDGSSFEQLEKVLTQIESGTKELKKEFSDERPDLDGESLIGHYQGAVAGSRVRFWMELDHTDDMKMSMEDFVGRWREAVGDIPDVLDFNIDYSANDGGKFVQIMLVSEDPDVLDRGVQLLRERLAEYAGTYNISDLMRGGRPEFEISLKPEAETLSLSLADIARQVRQGFYGEEVQRIPRGRDDVRVMLRYPLEERRSVETLKDMRIRTPDGRQVPFSAVANIEFGKGYTYVRRQDRHRVNFVFANLSDDGSTADEIIEDLKENYYPVWQKEMPELKFELSGHLQEQQEFMAAFARLGIFALLMIYTLMAVAFRSYTQPIIIMSAIPFGVMGAIFGHLIMGLDFAFMSYFGIIAACGVVVNDNLVLVDYINRLREEGMDVWDAIKEGAQSRFRPIVLTSVTTFVGLFPIMLERGMQAAFLGQMVVSLAFGVAFATVVTLILVPCLVGIEEDVHIRFRRIWARIRGRDPLVEGTAAE